MQRFNVAALSHFPNALGLVDIVPGDGDWCELRNLFRWLLAVAEEGDKYVDRAAALAARLLLDGSGQVAGLYLLERLRKRVEADERNFADEVPVSPEPPARPTELCWILGDGVDQAADISWFATSIPSRNFTPRTIFGN